MTASARSHVALLLGLVAVSTSGPFFLMAKTDPFSVVWVRTLLAGIIGLLIAALRGGVPWQALRRHAVPLVLGGFLLGSHLLLWVAAFQLTDFASNLLLLVAQPLLASIFGSLLGEPFPRHGGIAIGLACAGMLLIAGTDFSGGARALLGDALSIVAGGLIALFHIVARPARRELPVEAFMGATLLSSAIFALPAALAARAPIWNFAPATWLWLLAIVFITTLGGHGLMNYAAKELSLFSVNLVIVLEPVVALLMGSYLFGAKATWAEFGAFLLLAGAVTIGLRGARFTAAPSPVAASPHPN